MRFLLTQSKLFLWVTIVSFVPHAMGKSLTLKQSVELGLQHNFSLQISKNTVEIANQNKKLGVGGLLPTASVTANLTKSIDPSADVVQSLGLQLGWTLFDGFRMFYAYSTLEEQRQRAKLINRQKVEAVLLDVIQTYYSVWIQEQFQENRKQQVMISQRQLEKMRVKQEHGGATHREILQVEVAKNIDSSEYLKGELELIKVKDKLGLLLGLPVGTSIEVEGKMTPPKTPTDSVKWVKLIINNNSTLSFKKKEIRLQELEYKMNRAKFWPWLSASGNWQYTDGLPNGRGGSNTTVGLSLRFPLFEGFRNTVSTQNAKVLLENKKWSEKEYELKLEYLISQKWLEIKLTRQQLDFEKKALSLAEENFNLTEEQFERGAVSETVFQESRLALYQFQSRLIVAEYQALLTVFQLRFLAGKLEL